MNLVDHRPGLPVAQLADQLEVQHAVGQGGGHAVYHPTVGHPVPGGDDPPTRGQQVFTALAVQQQLVGAGLDGRGGGVYLVQEEDAFGAVTFGIGQKIGGQPVRTTPFAVRDRDTAEVDGIEQQHAQVDDAPVFLLGDLPNHGRFAYPGGDPRA